MRPDEFERGEATVRKAVSAIETALRSPDGKVSHGTETLVQNALHHLRASKADHDLIARFESVAASLRLISAAKVEGRVNLHMSRLLRLQRRVFA